MSVNELPPPEPRKIRPAFLFQLEEQRRQRRLEALQKRFDATIQHLDQVERVNEECYRRQMDLTQAAKTGSAPLAQPAPFPSPVAMPPETPPASGVFRKPWIRSLLRPAAAPPAPKPAEPPKAPTKGGKKSKRKK